MAAGSDGALLGSVVNRAGGGGRGRSRGSDERQDLGGRSDGSGDGRGLDRGGGGDRCGGHGSGRAAIELAA